MAKFYDMDVDATMASTEKESIFLKCNPDSDLLLRFLPPVHPSLYYLNVNHFGLQEEGDDGKERAVAYGCLNVHGDGDCPLCKVWKHLLNLDTKESKKLANEIKPSRNWYTQVLNGVMDKDGKLVWQGPYMFRLSKTGTDAISDILSAQRKTREPFITDPKKGKPVVFKRKGAMLQTKYSAVVSADPVDLNKVFPSWEKDAFDDLEAQLDIKIKTPEQMLAAAKAAHSADWDTILKEAGVV